MQKRWIQAAAAAFGRIGGRKGGPARAAKLSSQQRSKIARAAAQARWKKRYKHINAFERLLCDEEVRGDLARRDECILGRPIPSRTEPLHERRIESSRSGGALQGQDDVLAVARLRQRAAAREGQEIGTRRRERQSAADRVQPRASEQSLREA